MISQESRDSLRYRNQHAVVHAPLHDRKDFQLRSVLWWSRLWKEEFTGRTWIRESITPTLTRAHLPYNHRNASYIINIDYMTLVARLELGWSKSAISRFQSTIKSRVVQTAELVDIDGKVFLILVELSTSNYGSRNSYSFIEDIGQSQRSTGSNKVIVVPEKKHPTRCVRRSTFLYQRTGGRCHGTHFVKNH